MNELDHVYELENLNSAESRRVLGAGVELVQDLLGLYTAITDYVKVSKIGPRDEVVVSCQFLVACRYQLVMGSLSVLRLHITDSFYFVRKAIEFCAFTGRVKKHPHLAMVWLKAGDSPKAYKDYRDKFSPGKLFPQNDAVLGRLSQRYDHCCKMSHPSIYSLGYHITVESTEKMSKIDFNYFDVKLQDPSEPFRAFLWLVDTHFGILQVFEKVFADALVPVKQQWEEQRDAVDRRIRAFQAKWKPRIMP